MAWYDALVRGCQSLHQSLSMRMTIPAASGLWMCYLCVLVKKVEEDAGEVVGVVVGEAQLVGQRVQEQVAPLCVQFARQLLEDV